MVGFYGNTEYAKILQSYVDLDTISDSSEALQLSLDQRMTKRMSLSPSNLLQLQLVVQIEASSVPIDKRKR